MKKLVVKTYLEGDEAFLRKLSDVGMEMSPVIWQHERVYLASNYQPKMNYPRLVLRTEVRETSRPATYAVYLKRHIEDSGLDFENFTTIGNYTEMTGMIHQLGYRKVAEVSRQRREVWLDERTVIYLDVIEGIQGCFVKIEAEMMEGVSVETVKMELYKTLRLFGFVTFVTQTYAEILLGQMQPYYIPEF